MNVSHATDFASPMTPHACNVVCAADQEWDGQPDAIVGTCEEMCPATERDRRSRLNDIQVRWLGGIAS
jgi:ribosome modulation factor